MNKKLLSFGLATFLLANTLTAQFQMKDLQYFVGSGSDTAVLVVDFKDGSVYTSDSSYAWGYLFNGPKSGEDMLNEIATADRNFTVNMAGGFLNDVIYGAHIGIGGQPDYWSTWSGQSMATLSMNSGISTPLSPGDWFALSYTDFNPAATPGEPIAAFDPHSFTLRDVKTWRGSGADSAVVIIDFLRNDTVSSFAWGVLFNDSISGGDLLDTLANFDAQLTVNSGGGFLNDIIYHSLQGIGGQPNYWGTWSATNPGNWTMNAGLGTMVKNGEFFGATYTDFNPALRPANPQSVEYINIVERQTETFAVYPNPATDYLIFDLSAQSSLSIFTADGKMILQKEIQQGEVMEIAHWPAGIYLLQIDGQQQKFIKN